jgi:hypothetical protein
VKEIIEQAAARVAHKYARRCWWSDPRELRQEATAAMLGAVPGFDPSKASRPGQAEAFFYRVGLRALHNFTWRSGSPLSETDHNLRLLAGVTRAPVEEAAELPVLAPWADEIIANGAHLAELRAALAEVLGQLGEDEELARAVLLRDGKPEDVAVLYGVERRRVYRATALARRFIMDDLQLYELWKER